MNEGTGALALGMQDIYAVFSFDNDACQTYAAMATDAERMASAINTGKVVWIRAAVSAEAPNVLDDQVRYCYRRMLSDEAPVLEK